MQLANAPAKLTVPFAADGSKNTIPVQSPGTPGAASWEVGFPPETRLPVNAGGFPPSGLDFNGLFNALSALSVWANAGATFPFDATFAAAVGGYPAGALVLKANGSGYWRSTQDNNSANPDTGGAGWVPFGASLASSVYASASQVLAQGSSKVLFDTAEFDDGLWDAANKRFAAHYAGKYRLSGAVMLASPGGQLLAAQVWQNGALAKQCFQSPQVSDGNLSLPFDAIVTCAPGDYLEAYITAPQTPVTAGQNGSNRAYVFAQLQYLGA